MNKEAPFAWVVWVIVVSYFVMPFFYVVAIQPKYRQIYKDSKFLASRLKPALLYILAIATYLPLMGPSVSSFLKLLL